MRCVTWFTLGKKFAQDLLQQPDARRHRVAVRLDHVDQQVEERPGFVVGEVEVHGSVTGRGRMRRYLSRCSGSGSRSRRCSRARKEASGFTSAASSAAPLFVRAALLIPAGRDQIDERKHSGE